MVGSAKGRGRALLRILCGLVASITAGHGVTRVQAQTYPNRPVTLVHGFGAGGNADVIARIVAQGLGERLGQQVIVEPRTGAGGNLASSNVAKAAPDGYTLIMLTGGHAVSGALYKSLPFDPVDDFQMLSTVIFFPFVVAVRQDHPFKSMADLIAAAKAKPGTLTFSSVGVGSTQHLTGELLSAMAGIKMTHVPYRGGIAPMTDLLGGNIDLMVDSQTVVSPQIAAATVRGLGVSSPQAWRGLPGVSPISDAVPGFDVRSWLGLATTKGVPQPIADKLVADINAVLATPTVRDKLVEMGNDVRGSTPGEMRTLVSGEITRWKKVIAEAQIPQQ